MSIGTYVIEDPLFDAEHDDEPLLIMHLPQGSRLERAITYLCDQQHLDFFEIPGTTAGRKIKLKSISNG